MRQTSKPVTLGHTLSFQSCRQQFNNDNNKKITEVSECLNHRPTLGNKRDVFKSPRHGFLMHANYLSTQMNLDDNKDISNDLSRSHTRGEKKFLVQRVCIWQSNDSLTAMVLTCPMQLVCKSHRTPMSIHTCDVILHNPSRVR